MTMHVAASKNVKEFACRVKNSQRAALRPMTHTTVVAFAVPSVLALYGVGCADEPPSRSRISL